MLQQNRTLQDYRREIDDIDDALHDLLMRRAEVTQAIARIKQPGAGEGQGSLLPALKPAREAAILRRLVSRHHGGLPARVLARVFREIIAASLFAQSHFAVHVAGGRQDEPLRKIAAAHFGSLATLTMQDSPAMVMAACARQVNAVGLLPAPQANGPCPWWTALAAEGAEGLRIFAKLPFLRDRRDSAQAYAIGRIEPEASGDDSTVFRIETAAPLPSEALFGLIKDAGLEATSVVPAALAEASRGQTFLIEVKDFVGAADSRLRALLSAGAIQGIVPLGGFANPIVHEATSP